MIYLIPGVKMSDDKLDLDSLPKDQKEEALTELMNLADDANEKHWGETFRFMEAMRLNRESDNPLPFDKFLKKYDEDKKS